MARLTSSSASAGNEEWRGLTAPSSAVAWQSGPMSLMADLHGALHHSNSGDSILQQDRPAEAQTCVGLGEPHGALEETDGRSGGVARISKALHLHGDTAVMRSNLVVLGENHFAGRRELRLKGLHIADIGL